MVNNASPAHWEPARGTWIRRGLRVPRSDARSIGISRLPVDSNNPPTLSHGVTTRNGDDHRLPELEWACLAKVFLRDQEDSGTRTSTCVPRPTPVENLHVPPICAARSCIFLNPFSKFELSSVIGNRESQRTYTIHQGDANHAKPPKSGVFWHLFSGIPKSTGSCEDSKSAGTQDSNFGSGSQSIAPRRS